MNGHLECLQYLTEQGYHKRQKAAVKAKAKGHLDCYEYCVAHGYVRSKNI